MPGFHLYTSNRIENLVPVLGEIVSEPKKTPFETDIIVVQNKGMEQWLSLKLAELHKICACFSFPFPNAFFSRLFKTVLADTPDVLPFDPNVLTWKMYQTLPSLVEQDTFVTLRSYVQGKQPLHSFVLAKKITDLFDQYTMYRDKTVSGWEQGSDNDEWQSQLWRSLISAVPSHRGHLKEAFIKKITTDENAVLLLPRKISFFGISSLPQFYLDLIHLLSNYSDIHYFLLNPSAEYWDDIVSEKELSKLVRQINKRSTKKITAENLHFETGNTLLASLGTYGRDFFSRIHDDPRCDEHSFASEPDADTLLGALQSQILHLSQNDDQKITITPNDRSVQVHSCHNPVREIEVLYDALLDVFNSNPDLAPSDVVVMAPDIEQYCPYIKAIFNAPEKIAIPYSLSDRTMKDESCIADSFLEILQIFNSRFTVEAIFTLIERNEICQKFNLSANDLLQLKNWIDQAGVRWSLDDAWKKRFDVPETFENTWKSGINQLLLGFALPSDNLQLFENLAGINVIEGADCRVMGEFLTFFKELISFNTLCDQSHVLEEWTTILNRLIDQFFISNETTQSEIATVKKVLSELKTQQELSGYSDPVPFELIRFNLEEKIRQTKAASGYLNGNVTFCSLLPMRGIPFKIVCLIGMNENSFPRKTPKISWDIIASFPMKGDRSLELEDRYLFLESLLSARETLYISFIGQSDLSENSSHPSVCVEELLAYIDNNCSLPEDPKSQFTSCREQILTRHKLQAFNPAYFSNTSGLFSYSMENLNGARECRALKKPELPFFNKPLPERPEIFDSVSIEDLINFFGNPCKFILQKRLFVRFPEPDEAIENDEPFCIDKLDEYNLGNRLITTLQESCYDTVELYSYFKARNCLPHGIIGRIQFDEVHQDARNLLSTVQDYQYEEKLNDLFFDQKIAGVQIHGKISGIWSRHRLQFRNASFKAKDYLRGWINHLCLNCSNSSNYPRQSILISKDRLFQLSAVETPGVHLERLIQIFKDGLRFPLVFFPQTSWEYFSLLRVDNKDEASALEKAQKRWYGDPFSKMQPDSLDPYFNACFMNRDPFCDQFKSLAFEIFEPFISCRTEIQ